jgi:hypothetical protein
MAPFKLGINMAGVVSASPYGNEISVNPRMSENSLYTLGISLCGWSVGDDVHVHFALRLL